MSATFDAAVSSVDFFESTVSSVAANVLASQTYVFPYDVEVTGAAISGQTGTTLANVWANVKVTAAGTPVATTGGTSLFSKPFATEAIKTIKLDQSYVTVVGTAPVTTATAAAAITVATTTVNLGAANTSTKVGQGVVIGNSTVVGNYVTAVASSTQVTLAKPVTVASTVTTIAFFDAPTPQPGQQVQLLSIAHPATTGANAIPANFLAVVNNITTPGYPALNAYAVIDSSESTAAQTFRVGPIKQAGLYDTTTGFWRFTTDRADLTAGTWQILDAPVLVGTNGRGVGVVNYPDNTAIVPAGATLSVEWSSVNAAGSAVTGVIASNVSLNLAVKKR